MAEHVLTTTVILKRLFDLGYFMSKTWAEVKGVSGTRLEKAIEEFQTFHGLEPDGEVGPITATAMHRRRCGLPDFEMRAANSEQCRWPEKKVTYLSRLRLPGITELQAQQAFDVACAQWMAVCGILLSRVESENHANIFSRSGTGRSNQLDNKGGTLAWSELPCDVRMNRQLAQMYDEAEDWSYLMAVAVICHEVGHALGLPHLPKGNLMAPYYDPNNTKPQQGDIAEMIDRYGEVVTRPPTIPPIDPTGTTVIDVSGVITINGLPYVLVPRA